MLLNTHKALESFKEFVLNTQLTKTANGAKEMQVLVREHHCSPKHVLFISKVGTPMKHGLTPSSCPIYILKL